MQLLITGATGLIGRRLVLDRLERGDRVVVVSRDAGRAGAVFAAGTNRNVEIVGGNPSIPGDWQGAVEGCEAVIHLAGAGLMDRRWTEEYKRLLVDSRVDSTFQVVEGIRGAGRKPKVLVVASAVGIYGETGDEAIDEGCEAAEGDFLADLVVRWEREAGKAADLGVRVVMLRIGAVLDPRGGLLDRLVGVFRWGVGGPIGSGRQYVPWIHWRDLVGLLDLAVRGSGVVGAMNATAPQPVRNRDLCRALGRALGRPSWVPVPGFVLELVLGELGRYAMMSQRVLPAAAEKAGYQFVYPEVESALGALVGEGRPARRGIVGAVKARGRAAAGETAGVGPVVPDGEEQVLVEGSGGAMPGERIRLLAVGIDGALLRSDGRLSQGVVRACRAAARGGCVVVPVTARPPRSAQPVMRALDVAGPLVCYNGAVIWNAVEGCAQYHEALAGELAGEVIKAAREASPQVLVGVEVLDHWYTDRIDPRVLTERGRPVEPDGIGPLEGFLGGPVTQVNLYGSVEEIEGVLGTITERFWRAKLITVFRRDPWLLQVCHRLVDRGIALQRIAQHLEVGREGVMAIGADVDDMGMIEWAGFGVAMDNADAEVKALSDAVVSSNDAQGVARAIQRYVLGRVGA